MIDILGCSVLRTFSATASDFHMFFSNACTGIDTSEYPYNKVQIPNHFYALDRWRLEDS